MQMSSSSLSYEKIMARRSSVPGHDVDVGCGNGVGRFESRFMLRLVRLLQNVDESHRYNLSIS